jgi:hypothetical protein
MQLGRLERVARGVLRRIAIPFARPSVGAEPHKAATRPIENENWSDTYKGFRVVSASRCVDTKPYRAWFTVTLKHRDGTIETIARERMPDKYADDLEAKAAAFLAAQSLIDAIEAKR